MVKDHLTTHVQHIAYHAHDAPTSHSGDVGAEPLAGPHHRVVRQGMHPVHRLLGQCHHRMRRQRCNQHAPAPLAVFLATLPSNTRHRADIGGGRLNDPTDLAPSNTWGVHPVGDARCQGLRPRARRILAWELPLLVEPSACSRHSPPPPQRYRVAIAGEM